MMPLTTKRQQQGFILVATLWIIAFVAVAATYLNQWAGEAREQLLRQQQNAATEIEFQGTLATLLYLVNTHAINEYGVILNELSSAPQETSPMETHLGFKRSQDDYIKLFDQAYQGLGESIFSLQDESGLIATNTLYPTNLQNLLGLFGLSMDERDAAIAKLLDYEDLDDFHRINGAEASEYQAQGKRPPANRLLRTSWEMQNILDWDKYTALWQNNLPRLTSSSWDGFPNFNVSPKQVLQTSIGITRLDAEKIIQARNQSPLIGTNDIYQTINKPLGIDDLAYSSRPSNLLRVTLWHPLSGRMREIHLELHPPLVEKVQSLQLHRPWNIDYQLDIAQTNEQHHAQPKRLKTDLFNYNAADAGSDKDANTTTTR